MTDPDKLYHYQLRYRGITSNSMEMYPSVLRSVLILLVGVDIADAAAKELFMHGRYKDADIDVWSF